MTQTARFAALPAAVLLTVTLAGCEPPPRQPRTGGTAVIVSGAALDAANPLVSASAYAREAARHLLFLPLLRFGPDLGLEPYLAESWRMEGDTAAVFELRRDVRWEDGRPTTAYDAAATFRRALDPETGYPDAGAFARWTGATAVDSFTLRVTFRPHPEPLTAVPLLPVLPAHVLDTVPAARLRSSPFNRHPVTNGPFRLAGIRENDRWVFEANPDFAAGLGGRPRLDRLVWRVVPDPQGQATELLTGQAQMALEVRADRFDSLAARPGLHGIEKPSLRYTFIGWNGRRPPLDDPRVRRALGLAIDRQQILDALRGGHGRLAATPVPPAHWAHADSLLPLPFDPDSARSLLREAGIDSAGLDLELLVPAGNDFNRDLAQRIQSDLARVGVRMRIRPLDFSTLVATITGPDRDFDGVLLALDADLRLDLRSLFHSGSLQGPFQIAGFSDPRVDRLLDAIDLETDRDRARVLWADVQGILADQQPWTFLYHFPELVLVSDRLRGVEMDIRGTLRSAPRWWLEPPSEPATDSVSIRYTPAQSVASADRGALR